MKKLLVSVLLAAMILTLCACGGDEKVQSIDIQVELAPQNGVFNAPDTFLEDWDIPSIRDVSKSQEGYYSMPVYLINTYEELLHLKNIVGMELIGNEVLNSEYCDECETNNSCAHELYNEAFFEYASLLIGWHQYEGVVIPDVYNEYNALVKCNVDYNGDISVELIGVPSKTQEGTAQQWILAAVPKYKMKDCDSIVFLVKLPTSNTETPDAEENPDTPENPDADKTPDTEEAPGADENPDVTEE